MTPVLPAGCVIAVLGAPGTGKTWLANALAQRLAQRGVVDTDASGLTTTVCNDLAHADALLYVPALAAQRGHVITLLMALDLPRAAGVSPQEQAGWDARIRTALADAQTPYAVIHGRGTERLASAWNAILSAAEAGTAGRSNGNEARGWFWPCEKCSDPACEHRLFSELIGQKR
ncbi:hypothetical protein SRS16CHR_03178 [Variovorax sp. SRS16]|uniref:ATP-binding protein n=1 Tax=Variovorax sp. SRS16 TaxID=282217 RepID=UPI0013181106|nr:ATP-binding protein [Variovorax sp. SRS16]VTU23072.1 hypothetical protein SRS16CHR_03178 [Variovorax sp. SRS16]